MKKLFIAAAAVAALTSIGSAPARADYDQCLKLRAEVNAIQPGLGDKSYDCEGLRSFKSPQQRVNAAGGRTALIRKCEAIHKPTLKDPRSYRYDDATIAATANQLNVKVSYRAKNSFNAFVPGSFSCTFNG